MLYGRGSQGGIVNRVSKAPQPGRESTLEAQGGSWDLRSFYGDLSADPSDKVSVRLNVGQEDADSFSHKIGGKRQLLAPSLNWRITPDLDWLVQYEYSRYDRTPDRGIPSVNGRPADVAAVPSMATRTATTSTTAPSPSARAWPTRWRRAGSCATRWACSRWTASSTTPT